MKTQWIIPFAISGALAVAACGNNNDENNDTPTPIPNQNNTTNMTTPPSNTTNMTTPPSNTTNTTPPSNTTNMTTPSNTTNMTTPPPVDATCANYCTAVMANCTGDDAQYSSEAECLDYCENVGNWEAGTSEDTTGNTIGCRIYHGSAPAMTEPSLHCDHAGPSGGDVCGSWCDVYCTLSFEQCVGPNKHYDTPEECQTACDGFNADGDALATQYDTVQCRIYHAGAPAVADADLHCPHAAEQPTAFCVGSPADYIFRTDAVDAYTRVDRIGMPAVSTALITDKDGYNDQNPVEDGDLDNNAFVGEIVANLTAVHGILDDDLTGAGLTPCSMTATTNGLPSCVGQEVGGQPVAFYVIPDHLTLDPLTASGFPNGRRLQDPVMDVTLALILLDMTVHAPTALVGTNPTENDLGVEGAFLTSFPYLHPPHTP